MLHLFLFLLSVIAAMVNPIFGILCLVFTLMHMQITKAK